jgi:adenylate cyclase
MAALLLKHWRRMLVTLLPLVFGLLHADGVLHLDVLQRLDDIIYDTRLRATMPRTLDERVVIVDLDERSLAEVGRWPWGRHRMAALVDELFERQKIAVLGFDVVFAEPDDSSGLQRLRALAAGELRDQPGFAAKLQALEPQLDFDGQFARALQNRPVVLGYYFTSDRDGRTSGVLPAQRRQHLGRLWRQHRAAGPCSAGGGLLQRDFGARRRDPLHSPAGGVPGPAL